MTLTDAKNQTTTYTYDPMDRLASRQDALGRQETSQYDLAGNLKIFTDRKGQATRFTYDARHRRTGVTYADGRTTSFVFDTQGRLVRAADAATGALAFVYDAFDRVVQETTPQGTVGYRYDAVGRRTQMTVNGQPPITYQYDAAHRLTRVEQGTVFAGLTYDVSGRRKTLAYSNGTTTGYGYDRASRLTNLTHHGPTGLLEALSYTYDAAGNRVSLIRTNGPASQLPPAMAGATYDAANQQTAFAGASLTYDQNGNLTNNGTTTYTWDARNRLVGITGGTRASFVYDVLGRRVQKTINGTTTSYVYDGADIVQELGDGATTASYLRSLNIDEPFVRQGRTEELYHVDALGSPVALSNAAGAITTTYGYEPYGKTTVTGSSANRVQFTGRENDGTGLYYYRARYYSPTFHRFLSEDPIGLKGGINLFAYANNNPINFTDPFGFQPYPGPPPAVPGGPWTWSSNSGNSRGGTYTDPSGQSASWDSKGNHWDVDNGQGTRQRYNRWGKPLTPQQAHSYKGPKQSPLKNLSKAMKLGGLLGAMCELLNPDEAGAGSDNVPQSGASQQGAPNIPPISQP